MSVTGVTAICLAITARFEHNIDRGIITIFTLTEC